MAPGLALSFSERKKSKVTLSVNNDRLGSLLALTVMYLAIVLTVSGFRSRDTTSYPLFGNTIRSDGDLFERTGDFGWGKEGTLSRYSGMFDFSAA